MHWIKLYNDLPAHPKADALELALGVPRAWTHVVELWMWASKVRPSGDLTGISDGTIAKRAGWSGDAVAFVDALRDTGWLDGLVLHGWDEHQGAHLEKAARDAERKRERRADGAETARGRRGDGARHADECPQDGAETARVEERRGDKIREEERESRAQENHDPTLSIKPAAKRGRGVVGLAEQQAMPQTPSALLASMPELPARFAVYDGNSSRPTLLEKLTKLYDPWRSAYVARGPEAARAALVDWLANDAQRLLPAWRREGGQDVGAVAYGQGQQPWQRGGS